MSVPIPNPYFGGLRTAIYHAADLASAKVWYTSVLGVPPYFDQPYYVGFNVSGYELGLQPAAAALGVADLPGNVPGVVAYWGVPNAQAAFDRLLVLGATLHSAVQDVGENIKVATVLDPFGNVFGIIENPSFQL